MANEIENQVLRLIGEDLDNRDIVDIQPIRDSINDAIGEISILTGCSQDVYYLPLVAERTFYRINFRAGTFGWVTDAWLPSQRRRLYQTDLWRLGSENPRWLRDNGEPEAYFQIGVDVVGFYRRPTGANSQVELTCVVIPDRYTTDRERVRIRHEYEWATIHYAVSEYYASRGSAEEAFEWYQRYAAAVGLKAGEPAARERVHTQTASREPVQT